MSYQVLKSRARLLVAVRTGGRGAALLALVLASAGPANAAPFLPAGCIADAGGANDVGGETDVTRSCAAAGLSSAFELDHVWSVDLSKIDGGTTIHVCSLYNTDGDAFANAAVCTSLQGEAGNHGNELELREVRVYTCDDQSADRCSGATLLAAPYGTACDVSQDKLDPFAGPSPGPGSHYPLDTLVHCQLDAADFGIAGSAMPLDTCSFAEAVPDAAPSDCLLHASCQSDAECDDGNGCTADSCDASGDCRRSVRSGETCSDGFFCNGDESCTAWGACGTSSGPRPCDDGIACTLDQCDEISDSCTYDRRNSMCSDDLFCTGVEVCDGTAGCQAGTPPNCGDGIACTADACNEDNDGCTHQADDACVAVLAQLEAQ